jgi:hypothetical protein
MPRTAASKTYQARRYVAHSLTTRYGAPRSPQELRTKIRALKRLRFFGAEFWCGINPMIYGYARVSTDGQIVTAQPRIVPACLRAGEPAATDLALRRRWHPRTLHRPSRRLTLRSYPQPLPAIQTTSQRAEQRAHRSLAADSQTARQPPRQQSGLNSPCYRSRSSPSGCAHLAEMKQVSTRGNSQGRKRTFLPVSTDRSLAMVGVSRSTVEIVAPVQLSSTRVCGSRCAPHQRSRAWRNGLSASSAASENNVMHDRNFRSSGEPKIA